MNNNTLTDQIADQAVRFALNSVDGAGQESESSVKTIGKVADAVTLIVVITSIPHQIGYLLKLMGAYGVSWGSSPLEWFSPISTVSGSFLIPAAIDLTMYLCVRGLVTRTASFWSKVMCFGALLIPAGASCWVNYAAPGPELQRKLFGGAILLIPIVQFVRAFFRISFGRLQKMGEQAISEINIEQPPTQGKKCPAGCTCGKHTTTRTPAPRKPTRKPKPAGTRRTAPATDADNIDTLLAAAEAELALTTAELTPAKA